MDTKTADLFAKIGGKDAIIDGLMKENEELKNQ